MKLKNFFPPDNKLSRKGNKLMSGNLRMEVFKQQIKSNHSLKCLLPNLLVRPLPPVNLIRNSRVIITHIRSLFHRATNLYSLRLDQIRKEFKFSSPQLLDHQTLKHLIRSFHSHKLRILFCKATRTKISIKNMLGLDRRLPLITNRVSCLKINLLLLLSTTQQHNFINSRSRIQFTLSSLPLIQPIISKCTPNNCSNSSIYSISLHKIKRISQ